MGADLGYFNITSKVDSGRRQLVNSNVLLELLLGKLHTFGEEYNPSLNGVCRNILNYASRFHLFVKSETDLVFVPVNDFLGKGHEPPKNAVLQMVESVKGEIYFSPENKRFIGLLRTIQPEILQLAMPYTSVRLWELTGYQGSPKPYLRVETQTDLDYRDATNPDAVSQDPERYPELSRRQILSNLEFLLSFIPQQRPIIIPEMQESSIAVKKYR